MRTLIFALLAVPALANAQQLTSADSALVGRLLLAEERRDTSQASYAAGLSHADSRIRVIARRGMQRSRDPLFARRDSLPALPASPVWPQPAWRARFAALTRTTTCDQLNVALADSAPQVRIRAADLIAADTTLRCGNDSRIVGTLQSWLPSLPTTAARRPGAPSWQPAAHALVALSRTSAKAEVKRDIWRYVINPVPGVRSYVAQAAAILGDTATLRRLAEDPDDNVREDAIPALQRVANHSADDVIIRSLSRNGYQAVRAGAQALRGTPLRDAALTASITAALRLRRDSSETSRDARMALTTLISQLATANAWSRISGLTTDFDCPIADSVAAIGRRIGIANVSPRCTRLPVTLPPDAVRLALGADVRLRVTMADASGGGTIVVKLRGDIAPVMAARVLALAKSGYYDGRPWHRVEHNFVVQGGGGGSEYVGFPKFFRDELGNVPHQRGTIGMSTRGHDTGDAQWFFNLIDSFRLNRDYTVFAEVTEGMDVVDGIFEGDIISKIEVLPAR
jgi:cyclophilin family peptidyl-prolyl cis-trans isomerase